MKNLLLATTLCIPLITVSNFALAQTPSSIQHALTFYTGLTQGVNYLDAHGSDSSKTIHGNKPDDFVTKTKTSRHQYGAFIGLNFNGQSKWLNAFHPELSLWTVSQLATRGEDTGAFNTHILSYDYGYDTNLSALTLDALFDLYKTHGIQLIGGAGIDYGQVTTSNFTIKNHSGTPPSYLVAGNHTDWLFFYDIKLGANINLSRHVVAGINYAYYPAFQYRTGKLEDNVYHNEYPGIKSKLGMQSLIVKLSYLF